MKHTKWILALSGTIAIGISGAARADSNSMTSGLWGWDDSSTAQSRPKSWIPGTSYGYVGIGVGPSDYELSCGPAFGCDETAVGLKVFTGGKFSRYLGVEAQYVFLGKGEANGGDTKAQGIDLSLVAGVPIGESFNIFGKVGGIYGWTRTSAVAPAASGNESGFNLSYGAGASYDINRNWAVQGDWDHYRFDYNDRNADAQLYSVSIVYKF
ncbi:MAG TPA: outer membrane beta-barrel protein [Burkholderiales bacterium]|nr:outer membrane beta-barrel protein [Burkholderiales bacterium]